MLNPGYIARGLVPVERRTVEVEKVLPGPTPDKVVLQSVEGQKVTVEREKAQKALQQGEVDRGVWFRMARDNRMSAALEKELEQQRTKPAEKEKEKGGRA